MINGQQRDIVVVARTREREGVIEDSHLRAGRVTPIGSHMKQLVNQAQFHAPRTIRRRGSRSASR